MHLIKTYKGSNDSFIKNVRCMSWQNEAKSDIFKNPGYSLYVGFSMSHSDFASFYSF